MAATFNSVVLGQPEIASMVFAFQFGLYEDVRPAFRACNELLELDTRFRIYTCDPSFRQTFAPGAGWSRDLGSIHPREHALRENEHDARLPLHLAIAEGFVQLTQRILGCRPDLATDNAIILAFRKNDLKIAELLLDQRENAAERYRCGIGQSDADCAARRGRCMNYWGKILARDDPKGLLLVHRFGPRPDDLTESGCQYAFHHATLANATLALELFPWLRYPSLLNDVAGRGFLSLVRLLHDRGFECSTAAMNKAARNGHVEVVAFLHAHRSEGCTADALDGAAANGHLDVVQFLHFNRAEGCTVDALNAAITNGHLEIVRFLIEHRTEGASDHMLDDAAVNGRLAVLQYLHSLGSVDCTVDAVDFAARYGHLEIVQFLLTHRKEGCSRDKVVRYALETSHLHMAEHLLSLGYPFPTADIELDHKCFFDPKSVGIFELLLARGQPVQKKWLLNACFANNLPLVRFLHPHTDSTWRPEALEEAIGNRGWDIVRFFLANAPMNVSADGLKRVLSSGEWEIAAQILQRQPELRHEKLLQPTLAGHTTQAILFLLSAGIGNPRECLLEIAGHRQHVTASKLLIPHCMAATNYLDNIVFLLDLLALPDRRRKTTLQLITEELLDQGRKASQTIQLPSNVAARVSTLLEAGEVVDWARALVVNHRHATDEATAVEDLEKISLVQDAELKAAPSSPRTGGVGQEK